MISNFKLHRPETLTHFLNAEYQNLQAEIKSCFKELLGALPEPAGMESVTERLSEVIGMLEMLLSRLTYRQGLKDGVRVKGGIV